MKYSLARSALALAAALTLASCGGGGKATFPINVTVYGVVYPGMVMSTNGQEVTVNPPAKNADGSIPPVSFVFPKEIEYGETYNAAPKGYVRNGAQGAVPAHQNCTPTPFPETGTAGQLAKIDVYWNCSINVYGLGGTIKGLTTTGLVLANGSSGTLPVSPTVGTDNKPTGADIPFTISQVPYAATYGVVILTQPTGQTCTLTGGSNGVGGGIMDDAAEKAGGVANLLVTCK